MNAYRGCTQIGSNMAGHDNVAQVRQGLKAREENRYFSHRKTAGHWKRLNIQQARESNTPDIWHVLMDYEQNKPLKRLAMTCLEAWKRNRTLQGTGFAWARLGC